MRIWKYIDKMGDLPYILLCRGLLLSAIFLGVGCIAILQKQWQIAHAARDLSQAILLLAVVASCYLEAKW